MSLKIKITKEEALKLLGELTLTLALKEPPKELTLICSDGVHVDLVDAMGFNPYEVMGERT